MEHVFSTSELTSHSYSNKPNNVYVAIRSEVFNLTEVAETHQHVITVIPTKTILQYSSTDASTLFPVQVCHFLSSLALFLTILANQHVVQWCFGIGQSMGPAHHSEHYGPQHAIPRLLCDY